jgi:hypothetical protein
MAMRRSISFWLAFVAIRATGRPLDADIQSPRITFGLLVNTIGLEALAMSLSQTVRLVAVGLLVLGMSGSVSAQPSPQDHLSKKELKALLASASTSADHEKLARHFQAKAATLDEDAAEHEELAVVYRTPPPSSKGVPPVRWEQHCKSVATSLRKAAAEARKLADGHKKMAQEAPKS